MSSAEFWDLTMEEFQARADRWKEQEKRWDIRADLMPAVYINAHREKGSRAVQPGESFGHYHPAEEQSDEAMLAMMQAFSKRHNNDLSE